MRGPGAGCTDRTYEKRDSFPLMPSRLTLSSVQLLTAAANSNSVGSRVFSPELAG